MNMLEPEFAEPFQAWKTKPTPQSTGALLKAIDPVLDSAVKTYGAGASPTLRSHAKLIALDAMGRYDPQRAKLRTHLMVQLQGLRRLSAKEGQLVSIPERVALHLQHLHRAEGELKDELGRDPSDSELADHTGLSMKRIGYIRQAKPSYAEGQWMSRGEDGDDGEEVFHPGVVGLNDNHWVEFVHGDLGATDQSILEHSLGLHGKRKLSKGAIARKLRLSPGAVSQRADRIQKLLDKQSELGAGLI